MGDKNDELDRLLAQIKEQAIKPGRDFMSLAHNLEWLRELSASDFTQELKKTGLSRRTAYYLLELIAVQEKLLLSDADLAAIGWTKLQIVGRHLTEDNQHELIHAALNMTAAELAASFGKKNVGASRCMLLRFSPHEYELFKAAMIGHGAKPHGKGLTGTEEAILRLVSTTSQAAETRLPR